MSHYCDISLWNRIPHANYAQYSNTFSPLPLCASLCHLMITGFSAQTLNHDRAGKVHIAIKDVDNRHICLVDRATRTHPDGGEPPLMFNVRLLLWQVPPPSPRALLSWRDQQREDQKLEVGIVAFLHNCYISCTPVAFSSYTQIVLLQLSFSPPPQRSPGGL